MCKKLAVAQYVFLLQVHLDTVEVVIGLSDKQTSGVPKTQGLLHVRLALDLAAHCFTADSHALQETMLQLHLEAGWAHSHPYSYKLSSMSLSRSPMLSQNIQHPTQSPP